MKIINFVAVLLFIFSMSCKKDKANANSDSLKLKLVAEKNISATSSVSDPGKAPAVLDVKSYNAKTGEIIFNNKLPDIVGEWKNEGYKVNVYTDNSDTHLFTLIFSKDIFSYQYNAPVLHHSLLDKNEAEGITTEKDKWYILSGYPNGKVLSEQTIENAEQLKGFLKIKSSWNIFVDDLKKAGKYID